MQPLFSPFSLGRYTLSNRLAMAPMTRSRARPDGTPGLAAATYYAQRAGVGLIVTEGTQPSDDAQGYLATPGIYTDAHVAGWKAVTQAVHDKGAHLFIQLMHAGRMSHPDNTPHHRQAVAPSAIAPDAQMFTMTGMQPIPAPRALTTDEIRQTVADFRHAARRAIEAGADGVEIHGANGYLVQQFFAPSANDRADAYGGPIENRARFAIEVAAAIAGEIGADRTAIRLSPGARLGGIDEGPQGPALYRYLVAELDKLGLAYVHVMHTGDEAMLADIRRLWRGALIVNRPGRAREQIGADVASGLAELESYGQGVLASPDFVERLKTNAPMNEADPATFYGGGAEGYTDYPALGAADPLQRAVLVRAYGGAASAEVAEIARPAAGPGQVLVRVRAAGINGLDWKVREGFVREAFPLQLPAVLGIELAGVVEALGPGASRFRVGDRVMGPLGGLGAYADFVAVDEANLVRTPHSLDDVQAAGIPVAAVAAWQSLHHAGPIAAGQRILIHGAAGGLGGYAVQYARRAGAEVFATASTAHIGYVRSLGAAHVIDYRSERFESVARDIDLVLDYVGGDVLDRSWQVLSKDGAIVGTSSPDILARTPPGRRGLWFMNKADAPLLERLVAEIAQGSLRPKLAEVVGFNDLPAAIERNRTGPRIGKVVADFSR